MTTMAMMLAKEPATTTPSSLPGDVVCNDRPSLFVSTAAAYTQISNVGKSLFQLVISGFYSFDRAWKECWFTPLTKSQAGLVSRLATIEELNILVKQIRWLLHRSVWPEMQCPAGRIIADSILGFVHPWVGRWQLQREEQLA